VPLAEGAVDRALAPGSYIVEVTAPGRAAVREPIVIERDATVELTLVPPAAEAVPPGYVYIAPGWSPYGSAADDNLRRNFLSTVPLHRRWIDGFLIARMEVTFGDWVAYLDAQPESERAKLAPDVPAMLAGGVRLEPTGTGWRLVLVSNGHTYAADWNKPIRYEQRKRRAVQDWRKLPVVGISAADAAAYAAWLDRTGKLPGARLCSEVEWERAARGADGRTTPTGRVLDADDADIDVTYDRDRMGPDEVGTHPVSASPYGLFDTAGNAFEWTRGERPGTYVDRGGSFFHDRKTADLSNRNESSGLLRDPTSGMRLCATPR
jgi:formylglycine-generating enzyme required for sulfatase activity